MQWGSLGPSKRALLFTNKTALICVFLGVTSKNTLQSLEIFILTSAVSCSLLGFPYRDYLDHPSLSTLPSSFRDLHTSAKISLEKGKVSLPFGETTPSPLPPLSPFPKCKELSLLSSLLSWEDNVGPLKRFHCKNKPHTALYYDLNYLIRTPNKDFYWLCILAQCMFSASHVHKIKTADGLAFHFTMTNVKV